MPLEARLRPPALVVPSGLFFRPIHDLLEAAGPEPVHLALLAAHVRDERARALRQEGYERGESVLTTDADAVGHRVGQIERRPAVVEAGAEDRHSPRALAIGLLLEE